MKEIGGYFEFQDFHGREYHKNALRFNFARYAIVYTVIAKKFQTVYVPTFLCSSVAETLCAAGIKVITYPISKQWLPVIESPLSENEAIIIVNYFGQFSNEDIAKMQLCYHNVIIDNIQSFFQKPVTGVSTVYSCRKYFGVTDGAYLYTDIVGSGYEQLPQDYSSERIPFIVGRYEKGAQFFYSSFKKNEKQIAQSGPRKMSPFTQNLLRSINYEECILRRKENINYLDSHLRKHNLLQVRNYGGLFMYPFLQQESKDLRTKLIEEKIFVPKLWPTLSEIVPSDSKESDLVENIIWLPIDQRYGIADMEYIIVKIKSICGWFS